jgi:hypothetical protein
MLFNKIRVKEAMGRAGINEGLDCGPGGGVRGNEKGEGVREKSGRVELDLQGCGLDPHVRLLICFRSDLVHKIEQ